MIAVCKLYHSRSGGHVSPGYNYLRFYPLTGPGLSLARNWSASPEANIFQRIVHDGRFSKHTNVLQI